MASMFPFQVSWPQFLFPVRTEAPETTEMQRLAAQALHHPNAADTPLILAELLALVLVHPDKVPGELRTDVFRMLTMIAGGREGSRFLQDHRFVEPVSARAFTEEGAAH